MSQRSLDIMDNACIMAIHCPPNYRGTNAALVGAVNQAKSKPRKEASQTGFRVAALFYVAGAQV